MAAFKIQARGHDMIPGRKNIMDLCYKFIHYHELDIEEVNPYGGNDRNVRRCRLIELTFWILLYIKWQFV